MKKKLEADLISIAHRILKIKNKSELIQLHQETQRLYEKLSILLFVEENFGEVKPTIGLTEIESKISKVFDKEGTANKQEIESALEESFADTFIETAKSNEEEASEIILAEIVEEELELELEVIEAEPIDEVINVSETIEESFFKPSFELSFDTKEEVEKEVEKEAEIEKETPVESQIKFEDLLGPNYTDPVFVKPEEIERELAQINIETELDKKVIQLNSESKTTSINDQVSKGIAIGLNDRIGFIKHLFGNNTEDYNRVLSQLITFDTLEETQLFIDEMVKPDYNDWEGKDEYSQRFMEIIEKKFS